MSRLSARDIRTNIGSNLNYIYTETGLDPWMFGGERMREELMQHTIATVPEADGWRLPLLRKLLSDRLYTFYHGDKETEEYLTGLITSLVSK